MKAVYLEEDEEAEKETKNGRREGAVEEGALRRREKGEEEKEERKQDEKAGTVIKQYKSSHLQTGTAGDRQLSTAKGFLRARQLPLSTSCRGPIRKSQRRCNEAESFLSIVFIRAYTCPSHLSLHPTKPPNKTTPWNFTDQSQT